MIFDARNLETDSVLRGFDICIVGAGAAGITLAMELSKGRIKVCLLESGSLDYDDDTQSLYRGRITNPSYQDIEFNRLRMFGGTTNHWAGSCVPLDPIDFEYRPWVANSGWPFSRSHLDPFYARAHRYCDLQEFNYNPTYWRNRGNLALLPINEKVIGTAISQHSEPTNFGEKYRKSIKSKKNLEVYLHANLINIQLDSSGRKVDKFHAKVLKGAPFKVESKYYIIAMGGIENARILLVSNNMMHQGIGNGNDLVGRYFMDHPVAKGAILVPTKKPREFKKFMGPSRPHEQVTSFFDLHRSVQEKEELMNIKSPLQAVTKFYASKGVESFHALNRAIGSQNLHGDLLDHVGNIASEIDMVVEGISRRYFGFRLFDSAENGGYYVLDTMMESPPEPQHRVELGSERDKFGQRRVVLNYIITNRVKENLWRALTLMATEFGRAGVGRMRLLETQGLRIWDDLINYGSHHMGTTRAHDDPKHGVVDANLKVHGISNLFMAGSSVFPTGGHVPPTLTIVALSIRLSDYLNSRLAR